MNFTVTKFQTQAVASQIHSSCCKGRLYEPKPLVSNSLFLGGWSEESDGRSRWRRDKPPAREFCWPESRPKAHDARAQGCKVFTRNNGESVKSFYAPAHYVRHDGRRRRATGTAAPWRTEGAGAILQAMGPDGQAPPPRPWRAEEGKSGYRGDGRPHNEQARREQDLKCGILNSWAPGSGGRSVLVLGSRMTFELGSRAPEEIRTGSLSAETAAEALPSKNRNCNKVPNPSCCLSNTF